MNIVIIGGGAAACEAAMAAAGSGTNVTICSGESVPPYRRPALSRMVAEEVTDSAFYLKDASFYREHDIGLRLAAEAESIDRKGRQVFFRDGSRLSYDRLILATGGYAFVPDIPGAEYAGVLRDYNDLQSIRHKLETGPKKTVIIGGGVLGLELADSLLRKKCDVTLLEAGPALLSRNLDPESSGIVQRHLAALPGLTLKTCAKAAGITPSGVELADGSVIASELTVFSAGVRSCSRLAAEAGLAVNRGIVVDMHMKTSDPAIFSCGDAAETPCGSFGLLSAARAMGHAAGINAAGGNEEFVPEIYPVRLMALGIKLFAAGKSCDARSEVSGGEENFQRLTYDERGRLTGVILLGDLKAAVRLQKELTR